MTACSRTLAKLSKSSLTMRVMTLASIASSSVRCTAVHAVALFVLAADPLAVHRLQLETGRAVRAEEAQMLFDVFDVPQDEKITFQKYLNSLNRRGIRENGFLQT